VIIELDFSNEAPEVALLDSHDFQRFHVAVRNGDATSLGVALVDFSLGRLLPSGTAVINTAAICRLAAGQVRPDWHDDFAAMLRYAKSKGWVEEGSGAIQAHVEWEE
jgi:hypothetical protein